MRCQFSCEAAPEGNTSQRDRSPHSSELRVNVNQLHDELSLNPTLILPMRKLSF